MLDVDRCLPRYGWIGRQVEKRMKGQRRGGGHGEY